MFLKGLILFSLCVLFYLLGQNRKRATLFCKPSGKVKVTQGQLSWFEFRNKNDFGGSGQVSTSFDRTRFNQRAKQFQTRQIEHNTCVLWLERQRVDNKLNRLKLLFLYFTTNIWKCWNESCISPWISQQKCISPSICLKGATREVTYIIYCFYTDNNLILNLPKQTPNVFFSSPYLIQRAWTSSMFCNMWHYC